jgi:hypothetical protein
MQRIIVGFVLALAALLSIPATADADLPYGYFRHPYCTCPYAGNYQPYGVYFRPGPCTRPYVAPPWGWGYGHGPSVGMGAGTY